MGLLHDLMINAPGGFDFLAIFGTKSDVGGGSVPSAHPEGHLSALRNEERRDDNAGLRIRAFLGIRSGFKGGQVVFALLVIIDLSMKELGPVSDGMPEFSLDDFPWLELARLEVQGNASFASSSGYLGSRVGLAFSLLGRGVSALP